MHLGEGQERFEAGDRGCCGVGLSSDTGLGAAFGVGSPGGTQAGVKVSLALLEAAARGAEG